MRQGRRSAIHTGARHRGKRAPDRVFSRATPARQAEHSVKLSIDRLTDTPSEHGFTLSPTWWRSRVGEGSSDGLGGDIAAIVRAHKMGHDLFLDGTLEGALDLECGRCLSRYRHPIRERFRLLLEPAGDRVPADPEGAAALARDGLYLSDELEAGWFRGGEIDLGGFFQEGIALLFPVQPLCREECRGLCASCGADRNVAACECEQVSPSSPFAALRGLRNQMTEGDDR
jgi:uncharacterized protein